MTVAEWILAWEIFSTNLLSFGAMDAFFCLILILYCTFKCYFWMQISRLGTLVTGKFCAVNEDASVQRSAQQIIVFRMHRERLGVLMMVIISSTNASYSCRLASNLLSTLSVILQICPNNIRLLVIISTTIRHHYGWVEYSFRRCFMTEKRCSRPVSTTISL